MCCCSVYMYTTAIYMYTYMYMYVHVPKMIHLSAIPDIILNIAQSQMF